MRKYKKQKEKISPIKLTLKDQIALFSSRIKKREKKNAIDHRNALNDLTGREWIIATRSVFFSKPPARDKLKIQHPATFAETDIEELIQFFTKKGGHILDPFAGVSSALIAALNLQRRATGIELIKKWVDLSKKRIRNIYNDININEDISKIRENKLSLICGDSREELKRIKEPIFDFIVTSPPYWKILAKTSDRKTERERISRGLDTKYSEDAKDLGNIESYEKFLEELTNIFLSCKNVLKSRKYMCVIVSDFKHGSKFYMYHADLAKKIENIGFKLAGNTVLVQNNKNLYPYGMPYAYVPNIIHQSILIFRKP